jgi:hypothetical protein
LGCSSQQTDLASNHRNSGDESDSDENRDSDDDKQDLDDNRDDNDDGNESCTQTLRPLNHDSDSEVDEGEVGVSKESQPMEVRHCNLKGYW